MLKKMLKTNELIEHCKNKGMKFDLISEDDAEEYISNNCYFYKLSAYRFNFQKVLYKDNIEKYVNLDFAHLIDLNEIDNELKEILLNMCLKIEQKIKSKILKHIETLDNEDGYRIMQIYLSTNGINKIESLKRVKSSVYVKNIIEKYFPYLPLWVYLELLTFGDLVKFLSFYNNLTQDNISNISLLNSIRDLRNACAHNNCLINNLYDKSNSPIPNFKLKIINFSFVSKTSVDKKLKIKFVYDFCCLLELYYSEISPIPDDDIKKLKILFDTRMLKNQAWYSNNSIIISSYRFCNGILKHYYY